MPVQFVICLWFQQSNSLWFDSSTFLRFKAIKSIFQTMHFHWYQKAGDDGGIFFWQLQLVFFLKKAKCTLASRSLHSRLFVKLNFKKSWVKFLRNSLSLCSQKSTPSLQVLITLIPLMLPTFDLRCSWGSKLGYKIDSSEQIGSRMATKSLLKAFLTCIKRWKKAPSAVEISGNFKNFF